MDLLLLDYLMGAQSIYMLILTLDFLRELMMQRVASKTLILINIYIYDLIVKCRKIY